MSGTQRLWSTLQLGIELGRHDLIYCPLMVLVDQKEIDV
jgi:hypothetical protein